MKGSFAFLVMLAAALLVGAGACSTAAGGPAVPVGVVYWPPGRYALEATIEYERSTPYEKRIITGELFAELVVTPAGSMFLNSSSGPCRDPSPAEARRDESLGRRSFECGDVTFHLRPRGGRIGGEIVASVQEDTRVRGPCIRSGVGINNRERCVAYAWSIETQMAEKRTRLKVSRGS